MPREKATINIKHKILYISYDGILDPIGESQVIPYLKGLARLGMGITLISFEKRQRMKREGMACNSYRKSLYKEGIAWERLIYHKSPTVPSTLFDIACGIIKGWFLIKARGIKIVHARGYISAIIAYALKILTKAKFIFDMRGFWPEEKVDAGQWETKSFLYKSVKFIEKKMILFADELIVLTNKAKSVIESGHKQSKNINVIPCCVDLDVFSPHLSEGAHNYLPKGRMAIGYVGSTGTFYNFEEAVIFFKSFKRVFPEAYFLILANGEKRGVFEVLNRLNVNPSDYAVSSVPNKEVPFLLSRCAFSLIFYKRALSGSGCCPIKFTESLACGVPVVISSGAGDCDRIVIDEGVGEILKEYSSQAYGEVIHNAAYLLSRKKDVAARCRMAAEKYFSLDLGVRKYAGIYEKFN